MSLTMLDPTVQPRSLGAVGLAPRPGDLRGLRVGLADNGKHNAAALLEEVCRILDAELEPSQVSRYTVPTTLPAGDELLDQIARECDLVVQAVGD